MITVPTLCAVLAIPHLLYCAIWFFPNVFLKVGLHLRLDYRVDRLFRPRPDHGAMGLSSPSLFQRGFRPRSLSAVNS